MEEESYFYYCPACGSITTYTDGAENDPSLWNHITNCEYCKTERVKSLHPISYYENKAIEIYDLDLKRSTVLFKEEIYKNPQFSHELKEARQKSYHIGNFSYGSTSSNAPKCPTCKSTNIKQISIAKRAVYGSAFGLFSKTARSQFQCKNCGYKW